MKNIKLDLQPKGQGWSKENIATSKKKEQFWGKQVEPITILNKGLPPRRFLSPSILEFGSLEERKF